MGALQHKIVRLFSCLNGRHSYTSGCQNEADCNVGRNGQEKEVDSSAALHNRSPNEQLLNGISDRAGATQQEQPAPMRQSRGAPTAVACAASAGVARMRPQFDSAYNLELSLDCIAKDPADPLQLAFSSLQLPPDSFLSFPSAPGGLQGPLRGLRPRLSRLDDLSAQVDHLQLLGRGGQGLVFRARWQLTEVVVKVQVANPASLAQGALSKLLLEGPLSRQLRAPNVVETYSYMCSQVTAEDLEVVDCLAVCERRSAPAGCGRGCGPPGPYGPCWPAVARSGSMAGAAAAAAAAVLPGGQVAGGHGAVLGHHRLSYQDLSEASFDSLDGFGSPCRRRSPSAPMLSYSEALRMAGAAPGCYVTQIVMEYCDLGSLADAVARGAYQRAAEDRVRMFGYLRTLYDIAAGMSYLHSVGVIHGDLKPGNVLLRSSRVDSRGYQAKLADFGLAKCGAHTPAGPGRSPGQGTDPRGAAGAPVGDDADWSSYPYMAPENFDGVLGMPCDVWSFGATAHHMWTGTLPHCGLHPAQVCAGVCDGSLALGRPPDMPGPLWRLLRACLDPRPTGRPSFTQLRAELGRLQEGLCGVAA